MNPRLRTFLALIALLGPPVGCGEEPISPSPTAPARPAAPASESIAVAGPAASRAMFQTAITFGPLDGGSWGTNVTFKWSSPGASHFRWALLTALEYSQDTGQPFTTAAAVAWADTLRFHPDPNGGYDLTRPAWNETQDFAARFVDLPEFAPNGQRHLYLFAVRAVDRSGIENLSVPNTFRRFAVNRSLTGSVISLVSDVAGTWRSGSPIGTREVFVGDGGLRFEWSAVPGPSQTPVLAYSFALDDSTTWAPFSPDLTSWPRGDDVWRATPGPHTFWVRAVDEGGFVSILEARLDVFPGPRACAPPDRDVLVVLDTNPLTMISNGYWPSSYETVERALADIWFAGYDHRVFQTHGDTAPAAADLGCASSIFWFHSALAGDGDHSVLEGFHRGPFADPDRHVLLSSYLAAGGNLFLCGLQPVQAMRYFEVLGNPQLQTLPVLFDRTLTDPTFAPHWAATRLGIGRIVSSIGGVVTPQTRLAVATSSWGEYPDLPFDPLRWPGGPTVGGFGFYDRDVRPLAGSGAEVAYTADATGIPVAIRRLTSPGVNGNVFFLALHPYFVLQPSFLQLVDAVMADFGETPALGSRRSEGVAPGSR